MLVKIHNQINKQAKLVYQKVTENYCYEILPCCYENEKLVL